MPKVLVVLHLYYLEQIDYMIKKLSNIDACDWDLVVTTCEENARVCEKLKKIKPNYQHIIVENRGYDVYPFVEALRYVNLDNYDFVLKLHTKNSRNGKFRWRDMLIDALLHNKKIFRKNLKLFEMPEIGMIGSKEFITHFIIDWSLAIQCLSRLNITNTTNPSVAGTIFMIRSSVVEKLKNSNFEKNEFSSENMKTNGLGNLAHAIEGSFGPLCYPLKVKGIKNKINIFKYLVYFEKEYKRKNIYLFGIKFSFKTKK